MSEWLYNAVRKLGKMLYRSLRCFIIINTLENELIIKTYTMKSSVLRCENKFSCCCFTCLTFLTSKRFLFVAELEVEGCLEVSKSIFSGAAAMFVLFPLPNARGIGESIARGHFNNTYMKYSL